MAVVVVLRVVEGLERGEIVGWVDVVASGRRFPVRSAWELIEVLRRVDADRRAASPGAARDR